jgi:exodeoxyribonuclease-3
MPFEMAGYELVHHGEGRWNGVAIALRKGLAHDGIVTNFGDGPVRDSSAGATVAVSEEDFDPFDEARMLSLVVHPEGAPPIRVVTLYAPNGRVVDSPFYLGKLAWFDRLRRWLDETQRPSESLLLGGDFNVAPGPEDVWNEARAHGGTHVSEPERAAVAALRDWGLIDTYRRLQTAPGRFSWWDYRAGMFHRNEGMRIDLLYVTKPVADRIVWAEIDREARKGPPVPSDHAPVVVDLDERGLAFEAGWEGALSRIKARTRPRKAAARS